MHRETSKDYRNGISCGDGWMTYGHSKRKAKGMRDVRRRARRRAKQKFNNFFRKGLDN